MRRVSISLALFIIFAFSITTLSAQPNIKGSLKSWYVQLFNQKSSDHQIEIAKQITSMEKNVHTYINQSSKEIDHKLDDFTKASTAISKEDIQSHQEHYEKRLTETKHQLLHEISEVEITEEDKANIKDDMENIVTEILRDILHE